MYRQVVFFNGINNRNFFAGIFNNPGIANLPATFSIKRRPVKNQLEKVLSFLSIFLYLVILTSVSRVS